MTWEYSTLHIDGVTTTYLDVGSKRAAPIVLLHDGAFGSSALSCWHEFLPHLVDRYRVIAPDFVGYGGSSKIFDFDLDARTLRANGVAALCRALDVTNAPFIGSSFGGSVALVGAMSGRLPMSIGVSIAGTAGPFMKQEPFQRMHDYEPSRAAAEELAHLLSLSPSPDDVEERLIASSSVSHRKALGAARMQVAGGAAPSRRSEARPIEEQLAEIDIPFLFIAGSADPLLDLGWEKRMESIVPNSSSVVIEAAGHLVHVDQPEQVAAAITTFFDQHPSAR